jgi:uncharacterized membrane protein
MRVAPAAAAVLMLAACAKAPAPAAAPAAAASAPASAVPAKLDLRGQAVLGKDGYGIVPCGEKAQRIMQLVPSAKPFLDKFLEGGAKEFFVEAEAEATPEGGLRILRFHRLYTEGPGCNAPLNSMRFAAWGNEPFWAAVDAGESLRLERPGAEPLVAQPRSAREDGGSWVVEGEIATGKLSLRLTPGFCSDGMSDTLYAWSATVEAPDLQLKGCGFRGSAADKD